MNTARSIGLKTAARIGLSCLRFLPSLHRAGRCAIFLLLLMVTGCSSPLLDVIAKLSQYELGDSGPAGGIIVGNCYIDDHVYFIEAAPYGWYDGGDDPKAPWAPMGEGDIATGATGTQVGDGLANTKKILQEFGDPGDDYAAKLCDEHSVERNGVTYNDWFLPADETLLRFWYELYDKGIGGLTENEDYWSSTETSAWYAATDSFTSGSGGDNIGKSETCRVRPVRMF